MRRDPEKLREWRRRSKPLKRSTAKGRKKRDRQMGDAGPDAGLASFVRSRPCLVCAKGPCDVAHIRTRGAGHGTLDRDGTPNIVPLCRRHHVLQEAKGWSAVGLTQSLAQTAARQVRELWEAARGGA